MVSGADATDGFMSWSTANAEYIMEIENPK